MNQQTNSLDYISNLTKAIDFNSFDSMDDLLVIIPCYNEAKNIEQTVNDLLKFGKYHFLIIDDCSDDDTVNICQKNKWNYIRNEHNLGLSKSFRKGVQYAIDNKYKYVVQFDGDGQHNAEDIAKLFFFVKKGYDIITTSRYNSPNETLTANKKIAHRMLTNLFFLKTGQRITDPTCGMRMYNWNAMEVYVNNKKLEVEISSIAYMIKHHKMKSIEVPTYVYQRKYGESYLLSKNKKIIAYMLKQIFKLIF